MVRRFLLGIGSVGVALGGFVSCGGHGDTYVAAGGSGGQTAGGAPNAGANSGGTNANGGSDDPDGGDGAGGSETSGGAGGEGGSAGSAGGASGSNGSSGAAGTSAGTAGAGNTSGDGGTAGAGGSAGSAPDPCDGLCPQGTANRPIDGLAWESIDGVCFQHDGPLSGGVCTSTTQQAVRDISINGVAGFYCHPSVNLESQTDVWPGPRNGGYCFVFGPGTADDPQVNLSVWQ